MKSKSLYLIFVLLLAVAAYMIVRLDKEKKSLKRKYLLFEGFANGCDPDTSKYQLVRMNKDTCDYIVIKKKEKEFGIFNSGTENAIAGKGYKPAQLIQYAEEIDTTRAIALIGKYYRENNLQLTNTMAINFEYDKITEYLVNAKLKNNNLTYLRVYLGKYMPSTSRPELNERHTVVLTAVDSQKEFYLGSSDNRVINYGGLCPPPSAVEDLNRMGYYILAEAIRQSDNSDGKKKTETTKPQGKK